MPNKGNYICALCELNMKQEYNGIYVEEHRGYNEPYKIWLADLWQCPHCNYQIIIGFGEYPLVEHFEESLYKKLSKRVTYHIREVLNKGDQKCQNILKPMLLCNYSMSKGNNLQKNLYKLWIGALRRRSRLAVLKLAMA